MNNLKKYALYSLIALLFLGVSEFIYNYHNRTPLLISAYYKTSKFCVKNKMYSCGAFFLNKLVDLKYRYYKDLYPDLYTSATPVFIDGNLLQKYGSDEFLYDKFKLTDIYYKLGLRAYQAGDTQTVEEIWNKLIYLDPDTSFLYVELANLYYKTGNQNKGLDIISRCSRFEPPKKQCREFLETQLFKGQTLEPGFMSEVIKMLN